MGKPIKSTMVQQYVVDIIRLSTVSCWIAQYMNYQIGQLVADLYATVVR